MRAAARVLLWGTSSGTSGEVGMTVELRKKLFTADEFERLAEVGILSEGDRVELIRGEIVWMTPIGSLHTGTVNRLNMLLAPLLVGRAVVAVQNPVRLDPYSEPQPDIAVLRYRPDAYGDAHPAPEDVLVLIEVADSSLRYDRKVKLPLYAEMGVAEVWIVDLAAREVEVHRDPEGNAYRSVRRVGPGERLPVGALADVEVAVAALLPG